MRKLQPIIYGKVIIVRCKKEGCGYLQEFHDWDNFDDVVLWMNNWISEHRKDMRCIHELEIYKDEKGHTLEKSS